MLSRKLIILVIPSLLAGCGNEDSQNTQQPKKDIPTQESTVTHEKPAIPTIATPTPTNPAIKDENVADKEQKPVETPPTIAQVPLLITSATKNISYQVIARSNTNHKLKYELKNNPSWITIDANTGLIKVDPAFSDIGNRTFDLVVNDGLQSTIKVSVSITKHNFAPTFINTTDNFRSKINKPFELKLHATDKNNDTISFSSNDLPDWLTLNQETGVVSGTPHTSDYGLYDFNITATDGQLEATKHFKIQTVNEKEIQIKSLLEEKSFSLSSISQEITNPDSIAVDNKYIYIANDTNQGSIFVVNKENGTLVKTISSFDKGGRTYGYNHVSDLYVKDGRLYVASLSSNRVDIIDTSTFQLINSLGIGSWYGEDKYTLVHPQAVIANEKYVFVIDKHAEIAVYRQSDISSGLFLHIPKYAYFYLGGDSINRKQQLTIKNDRLIINDITDHLMASYDISDIKENVNRNNAIRPLNLSNSVSMLASNNNSWLIALNDSVSLYSSIDYNKSSIAFKDQYLQARQDNVGNSYSSLIDTELDKNSIYNLKRNKIFIDNIKTGTALIESDTSVQNNAISLDSIPSQNISQSLQNNASWDELTNPTLTHFQPNHLINIKFDKLHNIIVTSYAAQKVNNVDINIKLKNSDTWFKAFTIDEIPAYGKVIIPHEDIDLRKLNTLDNDNVVDLSMFINDDRYDLNSIFDNNFSSNTDSLIKKLKTIKVDWNISFGKYSKADGQWVKITPLYAREWVIMATNFAYLISSPQFKYTWFHYKDIYGQDFYGNAGPVDGPNGFFSPQDYQKYYNEIIHRTNIRAGVTTIGGGLGGGDVWGVDTWIFYSHYYANYVGASLGAVGHEFGHHWGSHQSAWANQSVGLQRISHELNQYFVRNKGFPYTDDNLNGFYKASNEERHGHGVENAYRRPLGALNTLEIYLKEHFKESKD
ncbi:putative Ig domain-containing protein [Photobacterium damselae subsp. damselae]|uniref:putative Ig domain-containing protein n=1 Tax=Photobacterium damselae TaxID=38293 RepID=UPI001F39E78C|nr:putative Ig domain-containing protein [Photobacterium damselae]UKA08716.1 putative Ig domain-containing protein [Photobacterium damselae subsp. damselae]UKA22888.1 putative Ig domain-containing protein [Photobacterium damselae subsp. damselae]